LCLALREERKNKGEKRGETTQQHYAPFSVANFIFSGQGLAVEKKPLFSATYAGHRK
jgi:hypothetical protein